MEIKDPEKVAEWLRVKLNKYRPYSPKRLEIIELAKNIFGPDWSTYV